MDISERMPKYLASYVMVLAAWGSLALSATASAQVHDGLTVTATTAVLYDATSGIYTYNYTFVNSLQSTQEADFIAIAFSNDRKPPILNISSPTGWSFLPSADRNVALWGATDVGTVPANYADDGNVLPSPYQIKPGQSLSGFSIQSKEPPDSAIFYAQGFAPLPTATEVDDFASDAPKDYADDSYVGTLQAPAGLLASQVGSPSVDGFLLITSPKNGAKVPTPANGVGYIQASVAYAVDGEKVDLTTFRAELNDQDVTDLFSQTNTATNTKTGRFYIPGYNNGSSPLVVGRNVLRATINGTDPVSGASTVKLARVMFYYNSLGNGDLNGDGMINCADLGIVKASFGKSHGQPGFDPRADVNRDGIVNVVDLSSVARQLPAGTVCN